MTRWHSRLVGGRLTSPPTSLVDGVKHVLEHMIAKSFYPAPWSMLTTIEITTLLLACPRCAVDSNDAALSVFAVAADRERECVADETRQLKWTLTLVMTRACAANSSTENIQLVLFQEKAESVDLIGAQLALLPLRGGGPNTGCLNWLSLLMVVYWPPMVLQDVVIPVKIDADRTVSKDGFDDPLHAG